MPKTQVRTRSPQRIEKQEAEHWLRCDRDLPYYSESHLKIRTKGAGIVPLRFNQAQRAVQAKAAAQAKAEGRLRIIILKARQMGLSTWTAARFFRRVHLKAEQKAGIVADQKDKGAVLFQMYDRYYDYIEEENRPGKDSGNRKGTTLALLNRSEIVVDTAGDATAGRASTFQMLHLSEMAFWPNAEDVYVSLMQGVPDLGSEVIIESTANGVGNFFHRMWEDAEAGRNGYIPVFLPWWIDEEYSVPNLPDEVRHSIVTSEDPFERKAQDEGFDYEGETVFLTPEQLAWRRKTITDKCAGNERVFRQEYPSTAREAFLVSGNCFFDEEKLADYEHTTRTYATRGDFVENGSGFTLQRGERGYLRIWQKPYEKVCTTCGIHQEHGQAVIERISERLFCKGTKQDQHVGQEMVDPIFVIGADTASGKQVAARETTFSDPEDETGGRDFSCADVLELHTNRQVAQIHGRMAPEVFAQQLNWLGHYYGHMQLGQRKPALLAVEKNHSSGETAIRELQSKHHYPNLYFSAQMNVRFNRKTSTLGWVTTKVTRMPMLDELAAAIRKDEIDIPCAETVRECYTFVRGEDGKPQAQEGCHDDRVISLAIALQVARGQSKEVEPGPGAKPMYSDDDE